MSWFIVGALCFGVVVGWITYRSLRRRADATGLSDIATVIGAVGGAAVTAIFKEGDPFGAYCVGLLIGFASYFILNLILYGKAGTTGWMGD
jgi:hypothetical protein